MDPHEKRLQDLKEFIRDEKGWEAAAMDGPRSWDRALDELLPEDDLSRFIEGEILPLDTLTQSILLNAFHKRGHAEVLNYLEGLAGDPDENVQLSLAEICVRAGMDRGYELLRRLVRTRCRPAETKDPIPLGWIYEVLEGVDDPRAGALRDELSRLSG